jgi:superfamily II DNA or RNA helicase
MSERSNVFEMIDRMLEGFAADKRSRRQLLGIRNWVGNKAVGTLEWATGVGKTRAATTAITLCRRDDTNRKVIIVVPKIALKTQWERGLLALGLHENTEVYVINSLVKIPRIECSLLILDEIHRYAAATFAKVFNVVKAEFMLGLTATLKRNDGKHTSLKQFCPIIDTITMKEALKEGYVAEFQVYNIAVPISIEDRERYRELAKNYGYMLDRFSSDFGEMRNVAIGGLKPRLVGNEYKEPRAVALARALGWKGNSPYKAFQIQRENYGRPRGQKQQLWGNDEHQYSPKRLFIYSLLGLRYGRLIRQFLYNHPAKVEAAERILRAFDKKSMVFGEVLGPVEALKERMGDLAVTYHSKMKAKEKRESLDRMLTDESVKAILTARALDEGADFPSVEIGIATSWSSAETQYLQRLGRVVRLFLFEDGRTKRAIFANLYIKDSLEVPWLRKAQKSMAGTQRWIETVEELLERELLAA